MKITHTLYWVRNGPILQLIGTLLPFINVHLYIHCTCKLFTWCDWCDINHYTLIVDTLSLHSEFANGVCFKLLLVNIDGLR